MALKQSAIHDALCGSGDFENDKLFIVPFWEIGSLSESGDASIDLRLGRWFLTPRHTHHAFLFGNRIRNTYRGKMEQSLFRPVWQTFLSASRKVRARHDTRVASYAKVP